MPKKADHNLFWSENGQILGLNPFMYLTDSHNKGLLCKVRILAEKSEFCVNQWPMKAKAGRLLAGQGS